MIQIRSYNEGRANAEWSDVERLSVKKSGKPEFEGTYTVGIRLDQLLNVSSPIESIELSNLSREDLEALVTSICLLLGKNPAQAKRTIIEANLK